MAVAPLVCPKADFPAADPPRSDRRRVFTMTDRSNSDSTVDEQPTERGEQLYDVPSDVEPGVGIVEAVADATGVDPMALPPLQRSVEVDAMNALLAKADADDGLLLSISYADRVVVIDGEGTITVGP